MKSIFSSKTLWFNALTILVTFATAFGYVPNQDLASSLTAGLVLVAPFVNILLRLVTSKPVTV